MSSFWLVFFCTYFCVNFLFSLWVYFKSKPFYAPKFVLQNNTNGTPELIDLHEKYKAFRKTDSLSFFRILFGVNVFFWIRFIGTVIAVVTLVFCLLYILLFKFSIIACVKKTDNRKWVKFVMLNLSKATLFFVGVRLRIERVRPEALYKAYFGSDYKFTYDQDYSLILSNHTGWVDILCYLNTFACGFIAKDDVRKIPLIGTIAKQMQSLFVKREDAENRHLILEQIEDRQTKFQRKEIESPLMLFPEGTVTAGKHIMKFKKGAFNSLLPVKPTTINTTLSNFHLSVGSAGLLPHFVRTFCFLYHNVSITELPVMTPNDFMYKTYMEKHPEITEKWEVFAEVAREVMCQASNLEKSEMTFRDSCDYSHIVNGEMKKKLLLETKKEADNTAVNTSTKKLD